MRSVAAVLLVGVLTAGCASEGSSRSTGDGEPSREPSGVLPTEAPQFTAPPPSDPSSEPVPPPERASPDDVRIDTAVRAVRHLAGEIGPRPGHTAAYFEAAEWVERRLVSLGWDVRRQRFPTPGGSYEGIAIEAGPSVNLIATSGDVRPGKPWLAVGAHLDTVPGAPGAEDNASGVGVLLAVAEAIAERQTRLPVVLVAFGSEEPRGPTDDDHHYGSRAYVASLTAAERRSLQGMVSLDRVGVGDVLPIGSAAEPSPLRAELAAAAARAGAAAVLETGQKSSDHWSFVRDGLPGVRLGSTPYAAYHSPSDVPSVVDRAQLGRTVRTVVAWLR
ncbi:MAG: M28 family peptidase [Nocardioides sp.]